MPAECSQGSPRRTGGKSTLAERSVKLAFVAFRSTKGRPFAERKATITAPCQVLSSCPGTRLARRAAGALYSCPVGGLCPEGMVHPRRRQCSLHAPHDDDTRTLLVLRKGLHMIISRTPYRVSFLGGGT